MKLIEKTVNPQLAYDVEIGGRVVGEVVPRETKYCSEDLRWHACIYAPTSMPFPSDKVLIQGFGKEPATAVDDALEKGVGLARANLAGVVQLAEQHLSEKDK